MAPDEVACASRIERVVVYARGAVVTRRVALPSALPAGAVALHVPDITPLADAGSFRAVVEGEGDREVVGVRARLSVPPAPVEPSSAEARLRALDLELSRLDAERAHLTARRSLFASIKLDPELARRGRRGRRVDPAARVADALAVAGLLSDELAALDARLAELDKARERAERDRDAARLALAQATTADARDESPPRLEVTVRLAPAATGEAAEPGEASDSATRPSLVLEYRVAAARWWPTYAARFARGATRVVLQIDALVAQATGEDWTDARLALSTADLVQDTRLPELSSLRLSRAQRPPRRGYRPPPEGLDAMFEGLNRLLDTAAPPPALPANTPAANHRFQAADGHAHTKGEVPWLDHPGGQQDFPVIAQLMDDDEDLGAPVRESLDDKKRADTPMPKRARLDKRAGAAGIPLAAAPPPAAKPRALSAPAGYGAPALEQQAAAPDRSVLFSLSGLVHGGEGGGGSGGDDDGGAAAVEPQDAWLDFDALYLVGAGRTGALPPRGTLGRLRREDGATCWLAEDAGQIVEQLAPPPRAVDPRASRGLFDFLYEAAGTVDIPSFNLAPGSPIGGRPHRITIASADAPAEPRFITVPRESAEVFREAHIKNPFDSPLLAGPVDIFVDGALTAQSALSYVDRGGVLRAGLGVEDRLRIARNARVDESTAGLLGGSLAVEHAVTIDLTSSLGRAVDVEVIDRMPVTDDKDLDIKLVSSHPRAEAYTQEELGEPVRKGLRWVVKLPAGGRSSVAFTYRLTFPSKNEIIGGNRRE